MTTCKEHESYCGLVRWERDDAQCPACLMYHEALKFRCAEIGMKARDARWRAAILALGKRIAAHEPLYDEMAALRLGKLEDFERLLGIEVTP